MVDGPDERMGVSPHPHMSVSPHPPTSSLTPPPYKTNTSAHAVSASAASHTAGKQQTPTPECPARSASAAGAAASAGADVRAKIRPGRKVPLDHWWSVYGNEMASIANRWEIEAHELSDAVERYADTYAESADRAPDQWRGLWIMHLRDEYDVVHPNQRDKHAAKALSRPMSSAADEERAWMLMPPWLKQRATKAASGACR